MDAQIAEWQTRAEALKPLNLKQIEPSLLELDAHLTLRSHIVGYTVSDADTAVWNVIRGNRVAHAFVKQNLMPSLCRWFRYIEEAYPQSVVVVSGGGGKEGAKGGKEGKSDDANYDIGLQDVGDGSGIVTRFPPEPSYVAIPQTMQWESLLTDCSTEATSTSVTQRPRYSTTTSRTRSTRASSCCASTIPTLPRRSRSTRMPSSRTAHSWASSPTQCRTPATGSSSCTTRACR
jgi:hypothetical protein